MNLGQKALGIINKENDFKMSDSENIGKILEET